LTAPDVTTIVRNYALAVGETAMKIRPIVIGMIAWFVLPLASANATAVVFDPGLNQSGAGADLERGIAHTAENFGRKENDDKDDHCDKGDNGDKGDKASKGDCHHCDDGDHGDKGVKGDHGDDCEKSPSKPR
jgi:hypothetical protein